MNGFLGRIAIKKKNFKNHFLALNQLFQEKFKIIIKIFLSERNFEIIGFFKNILKNILKKNIYILKKKKNLQLF